VCENRDSTPKDVPRSFAQAPSLETASQVRYSFHTRTFTSGSQLAERELLSSIIEYSTVVRDTAGTADDSSLR